MNPRHLFYLCKNRHLQVDDKKLSRIKYDFPEILGSVDIYVKRVRNRRARIK